MRCAISIFGTDRPGIIANVTSILADNSVNIEDASMTLLQGHFAMILVAEINADKYEKVQETLNGHSQLENVSFNFLEIEDVPEVEPTSSISKYVFHLSVSDTPGIVASVTQVLSKYGANIVDCATRKNNDTGVFTMILDVDVETDKEDEVVKEIDKVTHQYSGDIVFQKLDDVDL
ncbi:MAG: ACT domain-containing protein [Acidimicrobiia bacterium]